MPRIQMTPMVRLALYGLRIYLIVLMLLIGIKFVRDFTAAPTAPAAATTSHPTQGASSGR